MLRFTASSAIRALGEAGVGNDLQALISWLMDNETMVNTPSEYPKRQVPLHRENRKSSGTHEGHQCCSPDVRPTSSPSVTKPQSWAKVANSAKATQKATFVDLNDQIVGVQWILKAPRRKQRRRATGAADGQSTSSNVDGRDILSSTGMIELPCSNFT